MTEQQRCEIIKALAYGLDIKFAAECNDVTTEEVEHRMDMALSATCKEM